MTARSSTGRRRTKRSTATMIAAIAGFAVLALAGLAFASSTTLKTARNSTLGKKIVVDSKGMTVYELKGETSKALLCKSSACFKFWPPLKVSKKAKLTKSSGVKGKLGKLHRGGFYQVTLGGHPLYHFSLDKAKGQAKGNGVTAFGGTWHVVGAKTSVIYGGY